MDIITALKTIQSNNIDILTDDRRTIGYLSDLIPGNTKLQRRIRTVYESGAVKILSQEQSGNKDTLYLKAVSCLENYTDYKHDLCEELIGYFFQALGWRYTLPQIPQTSQKSSNNQSVPVQQSKQSVKQNQQLSPRPAAPPVLPQNSSPAPQKSSGNTQTPISPSVPPLQNKSNHSSLISRFLIFFCRISPLIFAAAVLLKYSGIGIPTPLDAFIFILLDICSIYLCWQDDLVMDEIPGVLAIHAIPYLVLLFLILNNPLDIIFNPLKTLFGMRKSASIWEKGTPLLALIITIVLNYLIALIRFIVGKIRKKSV